MDYEPGPFEPLDQAYYERILAPSDPSDLDGGAIDASGDLAATVQGLDLTYEQIATAVDAPEDDAELEELAASGAATTQAVDTGTGQPDPTIAGGLDSAPANTQTVSDDLADAPDPEEIATQVVPQDYLAVFDFGGTGKPNPDLTLEQQSQQYVVGSGDTELLPTPGNEGGPNP